MEALEKGLSNLWKHIQNMKEKFGLNVIVAINKYITDTEKELEFLENKLKEKNIPMSCVEAWAKGGKGAIDLAEKVVRLSEEPSDFRYTYELEDGIKEKINKVSKEIYGAEGVEFSEDALKTIEEIEKRGYGRLPICIAKTPYSFSDDQKNLLCEDPFKIHAKEIILKAGAEFVVVLTGKIFTMPGLSRTPSAETIDIDSDGNIIGIF